MNTAYNLRPPAAAWKLTRGARNNVWFQRARYSAWQVVRSSGYSFHWPLDDNVHPVPKYGVKAPALKIKKNCPAEGSWKCWRRSDVMARQPITREQRKKEGWKKGWCERGELNPHGREP